VALIRCFASFLILWACAASAQHGREPMHQRFDDPEQWAKVFDDPERDAWQTPDKVLRALNLARDATVADIGAGTGYFAVRLAHALPKGKVYGIDVEPEMVRYLNQRAERDKLANLRAHLRAAADASLPEPVDVVLIVDTYHHMAGRAEYFTRLRHSLKAGARVAIIDFKPESPVGPPESHRIPAKQVMDEMAQAGYKLATEHRFLPYQYFLIFN